MTRPIEALMATACWPVGAGEGHDPGTDTVLGASRRDHTSGAPMWVRLMEGLGVLLAGARGLGHDAVRGGKNCKGSGQSLTNRTRAQLKWNQPAGFSLA